MDSFLAAVTLIPSAALIWLMMYLRFKREDSLPGFSWYAATLLLSALLFATNVRTVPGGPFVSFHADLLPALGLSFLLRLALSSFGGSVMRKTGLSLVIIFSLGLLAIIVMDIDSFARGRFSRGALFGW